MRELFNEATFTYTWRCEVYDRINFAVDNARPDFEGQEVIEANNNAEKLKSDIDATYRIWEKR